MVKEVTMPKLTMTQETGTILQWYKTEGDPVETGEPLLEVMTNKVSVDVESYNDGVLLKRLYDEGTEVHVLEVIAYVGNEGERIPDNQKDTEDKALPVSTGAILPSNHEQEPELRPDKVRATPAARALARLREVNLRDISGSGNCGRIHKEDVQAFIEKRDSVPVTSPSERRNESTASCQSQKQISHHQKKAVELERRDIKNIQEIIPGDTVVQLTGIRQVIGERMAQSAFQAPHVTLTLQVDMSSATELHKQMLPLVEDETDVRLSNNTLVLKVVASVLRKHPNINATWHGKNELVHHKSVNLGMAVAVPNGLVVPVIPDVDRMGFSELSIATKRLREDARAGKLPPDAFSGGTFTVSNLGMYGIEVFTPIINSPQVAILGVGSVIEKPVAVNGKVEVRPQMVLSLSFDHRALDGAEAAMFLKNLKQVLEQPLLILK
jgi:pyruvate dehydrogenase E2 component (dihydrolipoamide acetyltransferase)